MRSAPAPTPMKTRFSGEKCDTNNLCIDPQTCTSGVCTGAILKEACKTTMDCKVGLFCNATNITVASDGTCASQVKANSICTNDFMCPQTQGCLNGLCVDYYSQKLGVNTTSATSNYTAQFFCTSMQATSNGSCYGIGYDTTKTNMTANGDGLVKCDLGANSTCFYTDNMKNSITEKCQCSYDKNGASYCRKQYVEGDSNWNKLASAARARISSAQCHTMNRMNCWDKPLSARTDNYDASIATVAAHDFFYADDCIKKLFNAGEFVRLSFVILAALLINLI